LTLLPRGDDGEATNGIGDRDARSPRGGNPDGGPRLMAGAEFDLTRELVFAEVNTLNLAVPPDAFFAETVFDAIPALSHPPRIGAGEPYPLGDEARAIVVAAGDETVAYPLAILEHHRIVNDTIGGVPVVVTLCPWCEAAVAADRRTMLPGPDGEPQERALNFGVSGLLHGSNLVMYDKTSRALWTQLDATCISGDYAGARLAILPAQVTTLGAFRARHRDGLVVSLATGYVRDYGGERTGGDDAGEDRTPPDALRDAIAAADRRLPARTPGIGLRDGASGDTWFVPLHALEDVADALGVDTPAGPVVLAAAPGGFTIESAPQGVEIVHAVYFAWSATHPQTQIVAADQPDG
jgi:hypothetical protein